HHSSPVPRVPPSFPTRPLPISDAWKSQARGGSRCRAVTALLPSRSFSRPATRLQEFADDGRQSVLRQRRRPERPQGQDCCHHWRSEEHTSELQSRENLVCRLLL